MSEILARASGLVLGYEDTIAVAEGAFEIPLGSVTAIIGPNGSGKSTVLHALAGILPVRGGELLVLGAPPGRQIRRVAYVMQTVAIPMGVPITVRETVAILKQADLAPLDVSGYGSLEEREAAGDEIDSDERALMQRALDENSVVVAQMTPFYD